jgi:DNA-binding transcriptional LysR family regulator
MAEAMESACSAIERERVEQTDTLSGHARIGATEGYGSLMLAAQLAELTRRYPNLGIDLLAIPRMVHLSRR